MKQFGNMVWAIFALFGIYITVLILASVCFGNEALLDAVRGSGAASANGIAANQAMALSHARYMAACGVQGHQGWERRRFDVAGVNGSEVCNESWPGQTEEEAALEMIRSWKLSPGHWASVNSEHDYYGYAMVLGDNGIWYACGVFSEER